MVSGGIAAFWDCQLPHVVHGYTRLAEVRSARLFIQASIHRPLTVARIVDLATLTSVDIRNIPPVPDPSSARACTRR